MPDQTPDKEQRELDDLYHAAHSIEFEGWSKMLLDWRDKAVREAVEDRNATVRLAANVALNGDASAYFQEVLAAYTVDGSQRPAEKRPSDE